MLKSSKRIALYCSSACRYLGIVTVLLAAAIPGWSPARAAAGGETRSAGGLTVYLGVIPAEITKNPPAHSTEPAMHGGSSGRGHEHHIVVAVYESAGNARISDATVTAKASGLGLSGPQKTLEAMKIADTTTYGAFFNLYPDIYTIRVTVQRPGTQPVVLNFNYDHRRR